MPESFPSLVGLSAAHRRRLTWAVRGRQEILKIALARDTSEQAVRLRACAGDDLDQALGQMIMDLADPTSNKRFTPWLVREYAEGRLILEDLGPASETLSLFQRYASRLEPEQRDIQRYENLAAAWEAVREFVERNEVYSNRAQKSLDRAKAYAESRILRQDPDGFTVAVPMTEFAAKWWGRGTRWCTAGDQGNAFGIYYEEAPLFVFMTPNGRKYQLWASRHALEFRDEADRNVSWAITDILGPIFEPFGLFMARRFGKGLNLINHSQLSAELCNAAVLKDGMMLEFIPDDLRTGQLCLSAVRQNGLALKFIPARAQTKGLCEAAIEQNPGSLSFVAQRLRSKKLCQLAIERSGGALQDVPERFRDYGLCRRAVSSYGFALNFVPQSIIDLELCILAAQQAPSAVGLAPIGIRSSLGFWETLMERRIPFPLADVPRDLRTKKICSHVLAHYPFDVQVLQWSPFDDATTSHLYEVALSTSGNALDGIPIERRTAHLCMVAVKRNGAAIQHVPEWLRTPELLLEATKQTWQALVFLEETPNKANLITSAVIDCALAQSGRALALVPDHERTHERCLRAVADYPMALLSVPCRFLDDKMFRAVKHWNSVTDTRFLRHFTAYMSKALAEELRLHETATANRAADTSSTRNRSVNWPMEWLDELTSDAAAPVADIKSQGTTSASDHP